MSEEELKIAFTLDDGEEIELTVIEQTKLNGKNYLLVAEMCEDDMSSDAFILREEVIDEEEIIYNPVEDEEELQALSKVFSELLDDFSIEME